MDDAVFIVFDDLVNDFVHPYITDWHKFSATPENPSGVLTTNLWRNLANTLVSNFLQRSESLGKPA